MNFIGRISKFLKQFNEFDVLPAETKKLTLKKNITTIGLVFASCFFNEKRSEILMTNINGN